MKKQTIGSMLFLATISAITIGCGGSSSSTSQNGWNGKLVDSGVQGVEWECGSASGKTLKDGLFGECPAGSSVTFSIGGIVLGKSQRAETSDRIFTIQDLLGVSRIASENTDDENAAVNAIAALLLTLDNDGDPSNGITIETAAATAATAAITSNGGAITAGNIESITAAIVAAIPALIQVSVTEAETHLVQTGIEIGNGTITPPLQPSGAQGGN